jgi:hypothetical protein
MISLVNVQNTWFKGWFIEGSCENTFAGPNTDLMLAIAAGAVEVKSHGARFDFHAVPIAIKKPAIKARTRMKQK